MPSSRDQQVQASSVALVALEMPDHALTSADVLQALNAAYEAGVRDTTHKLASGILRGGRGTQAQAL
jgi:hypothetical protein